MATVTMAKRVNRQSYRGRGVSPHRNGYYNVTGKKKSFWWLAIISFGYSCITNCNLKQVLSNGLYVYWQTGVNFHKVQLLLIFMQMKQYQQQQQKCSQLSIALKQSGVIACQHFCVHSFKCII